MRDTAIIGMMRSGSTLVENHYHERLRAMGIAHHRLNEFFNPGIDWEWTDRGPQQIGGLKDALGYTFEERLAIWNKANYLPRLLKHNIFDRLDNRLVCDSVNSDSMVWIETRRDHREQCLSYLIAWETGVWNLWDTRSLDSFRSSVTPFVADMSVVDDYARLVVDARHCMDHLRTTHLVHVVRYEHVLSDLDRIGHELHGAAWPSIGASDAIPSDDIPKKLLTFDEKCAIIANSNEVLQHLQSRLAED